MRRVGAPPVFTKVQFQRAPDFCGRWLSEICMYLYRRQGRRRDRARCVTRVRTRAGPPPAAAAPINALPLARLAALAKDVVDFADAADLDTWLGRVTAREAD